MAGRKFLKKTEKYATYPKSGATLSIKPKGYITKPNIGE